MTEYDWYYGDVLRHPLMDIKVMFIGWTKDHEQWIVWLDDRSILGHPLPTGVVGIVDWRDPDTTIIERW